MGLTRLSTDPSVNSQSTPRRWLEAIARRACEQETVRTVHGLEVIFLHLLAALLILGWLGLLLGELGYFSVPILGMLTLLAASTAYLVLRRLPFSFPISLSPDVLAIIPPLVLAAWLFTPPSEFILGGLDPGVYVNTAASIARTGSILIVDREMAELSPRARVSLFREPPLRFTYGSRLEGFYIVDLDQGLIAPHGFHLYPTMLAIAYGLGGIWGSLWAMPVIALLGLAAFFLVARRLFGTTVALLAATLLTTNPAMIWFAHYPAAENLVFLWLFGGLLAFVMMLDTRSRRLGMLAGLAFGAVHLTKIEAVMLPVALGSFLLYQLVMRRWRIEYWHFLFCYGLALLHAILHSWFVSTWYAYSVIVRNAIVTDLGVAAILGLLVLAILILARAWIARLLSSGAIHRVAPFAVTTCLLLLAGYAYYVRPRIDAQVAAISMLTSEQLYWWANRMSFVMLGWYVAPFGLLLGVLGYTVALIRMRATRDILFFTLVLLDTIWLLNEARITPVHFWAARRFVPVVFPAFALFSAYALWRLQVVLRNRWPEAIIPAALGIVILASCLGGWLPFRSHVEYRGAVEQIGRLAAVIPENSIVLFDDSDTGRRLSAPLQFIWERTSFILWKPADEDDTANELISEWLAQGHQVYWIRDDAPPDVARWGYGETLVASSTIDLPEVLATIDRRPDVVGEFRAEVQVYRILPKLGGWSSAVDDDPLCWYV